VTRGALASRVGRHAALAVIGLLQAYWFLQPMPAGAKALNAVVLLASLLKPEAGPLIFAGLAPISMPIAGLLGGGPGFSGHLLEQMALSAGAGALLRGTAAAGPSRIGPPGILVAAVAMASALASIPVTAAPLARGFFEGGFLGQLLSREASQGSVVWVPLIAAIVIAECAVLAWSTEMAVRRTPQLAWALVRLSLAGHAAAAILDLEPIVAAAFRTGDARAALPGLLMTSRISMQTDVHAAASALLLAAVAGVGLMTGPWLRRIGVGLLILLVALGLWITGSRVAMVLAVVTTFATLGWLAVRRFTYRRVMLTGASVVAIGAGVWLATYLREPSARNGTIENSVNARVLLAKAGLQMFTDAPIFGIGITQFYGASTGYLNGSLGPNFHENAHNNFLQVLAEQGVIGLGAMVWWLAVILMAGVQARGADPLRGALIAAVVATVGTWMTGHPLLVPEFSFVFWQYAGILVGLAPVKLPAVPRWLVWTAAAGLIVSAVPRAITLRNAGEFEHRGFGVSIWHTDDVQRFREAGGSFALFLPATGRTIELPMRRTDVARDPLELVATIGGHPLARLSISGNAWNTVTLIIPAGSRRFELVEFAAAPSAGETAPLVRIGKAVVR